MRVLRRVLGCFVATSSVMFVPTVLQAQIGHTPAKSPYEDYSIGQTLSIMAGQLSMTRDPANVAPKTGLLAALRYDVRVGGPASLFVRYALAPSTRNTLDPSKPAATRVIGSTNVTTHVMDFGLNLDLTGKKTYRRFLPSAFASAGLASDFAAIDSGGYQFGTNFAFTYGFALRYVPRRGPQIRLDLSKLFWQYQYPDRYFVQTSDTTAVLRSTRQRSAWRGNWGATLGITVPIFR